MKILAIETSCDETAIALVKASGGLKSPKFKILKNLVASQIKIHQPFGGVVPNLAKREHLKNLPILCKKVVGERLRVKDIDLIAATVGPGLEPALWTGINFASQICAELRGLSPCQRRGRRGTARKIPLLGVSHLDGHLYSNILENIGISKIKDLFPAINLLISGGHTMLILMNDLTHYKKLGETVDDAVGEAFDKVARLLNLPYPGGPEIEKIAKKGNPNAINFPRPMLNQKNYNFSFSGLKTAVLYYLRDYLSTNNELFSNKRINKFANSQIRTDSLFVDIAASFQQAAFEVLVKKTLRAAEEFNAKSIMISGGVAANKTLSNEFKRAFKKRSLVVGCKLLITQYPTDNAAMIASAAYINFLRNKKYPLKANGNLNIK